ncbi:stage 0 sporulation family protein [Plantactinospora sp. GCM10030261]|uniref:PSP1 domain-containing protein n=1 Tax=Plantactinospora sp. GCM10030261 TaxID=3273420 RepID=UPI003620504E
MGMLCAVSFNRYGRLYYLDPGDLRPQVGDRVLVPTDDGPEVAECVWAAQWVSEDTSGFPQLAGLADEDDLRRDDLLRTRKAEAKVAAKRLIREHALPMKVVAVDHVLDETASGGRTTIYFTAPHRVDFRSLVRDLGATLRCRVELRQLSARDSARVQGGIGPCGRDLCCATFLNDFEPVTIRMAKDQDLPLNPLRISGACGRLMCCLKYEHPLYAESTNYPASGQRIETPEGTAKVVSRHPPSETVTVRQISDGSVRRCALSDVCGPRQAYESR